MKNRKWLSGYMVIWLIGQLFVSAAFAQEATDSATTSTTAEEKAQQIREAVQEKIKSYATGKPYAFVGTVKNLANQTLTIETKNGLKQASTSAQTTLLRLTKQTRKEIEFSDLELQESVIAMGYLNESGALEVKRLIATEITPPPTRKIIMGKVSEIEKSVLTIKNPKSEEIWQIKIDTKSEMTMKEKGEMTEIKLEDIGLDDRLIAICKPAPQENQPLPVLHLHLLRP